MESNKMRAVVELPRILSRSSYGRTEWNHLHWRENSRCI